MPFEDLIQEVNDNIEQEKKKRARLKDLDLIVLDNSLRESTVGQLRGHTLENKRKIYDEVRKCGFQFKIVAAYSHMPRVDDSWVAEIVRECEEGKEDLGNLFAFSEFIESVSQGIPDTKTIPVGLRKMQEQGLINPIIEIDLAIKSINWEKFTMKDMFTLLTERFKWSRKYLSPDAKIMVNLRDFPDAMVYEMERLFSLVDYIASMPAAERPFGIMFEEPTGKFLPEEVGAWTAGKLPRLIVDTPVCDIFLLVPTLMTRDDHVEKTGGVILETNINHEVITALETNNALNKIVTLKQCS